MILGRCDHCKLAFHTTSENATIGCGCLKYGCGCRVKREQTKGTV